MRVSQVFLIASLLLLPALARANEADPCDAEFAILLQESQKFSEWSFESPFPLTPEHVLPPDYLEQLRTEVGPVRVQMTPSLTGLQYKVKAGDATVMKWGFFRTRSRDVLRIDDLRFSNPLPTSNTKLRLSQRSKGLPVSVFIFAKKQLIAFARAGHFKRLESDGAQNYTVLMLYRRLVGMDATTEKGREMIRYLDRLYRFAQSLPEDIRPKSLDDFSRAFGDHLQRSLGYRLIQPVWSNRANVPLPPGVEILHNENREILGLSGSQGGQSALFFVDSREPDLPILQWADLTRGTDALLKLQLDLQ